MSQPQMNPAEQNIRNGIPPQMRTITSSQEKLHYNFNGVHSSNSSRDSSPSSRLGHIPLSHLPPTRHTIPASQLPPSMSPVTTITQKIGQLNVSNQVTPNISPKFSTSTPNQFETTQKSGSFGQSVSPVSSSVPKTLQQSETLAVLDNVPLTSSVSVQNVIKNAAKHSAVVPSLERHSTYLAQKSIAPSLSSTKITTNITRAENKQNVFNQSSFTLATSQPQQYLQGNINKLPIATYIPQSSTQENGPLIQQHPSQIGLLPQNQIKTSNTPAGFNVNASNNPQVNNANYRQPITFVPQNQSTNKASVHNSRYPTDTSGNYSQSTQNNSYPPQNYQMYMPQQQQQNLYQTSVQQVQNHQSVQSRQIFQQPEPQYQNNSAQLSNLQTHEPYQGVASSGFNRYWGTENYDLLQVPNILPPTKMEAPRINLGQETLTYANCSPEILRCTMTKIPENSSLLQKSRLPLGVLIHPFKDLSHLPVIQCNVIVRCRACRTYINPFVFFVDSKRWKCNLCYRINELPEEFQYDPVSKTYGDPSRRPEIKTSTIEYIAPAEYMLRPPQPAVYLFLLDISRLAIESGYLTVVCNILLEELQNLPGDSRTQVGFLAYDSGLHFYSLAEGLSQPHEMTILDIDDAFLPTPDNLLINLKDRKELVEDLLSQLPNRYNNSYDNNSALGAALQVAYKMMGPTGGRVTVFQASLPNIGPGALLSREDPSQRASVEVAHLNPANDFYKRLALECSGQQIAVDLFIVNSQYVDIATISGISRFSGGCIHHFPLFKASKPMQCETFIKSLRRYLTRKIGFEAVMRIRCTRGLSIHTFHGNFFVRSTDLLSLPNINPDAGFGMQVSIEENLSDVQSVCFQAALLYTSSKGERRIRVHTLCLPIASTLQDIIHSADQQCIIGLLAKMAVDRSMQSNISDAREAFINVAIDILSSYKFSLNLGNSTSGLLAPACLRILPLYISALLKHTAFRTGTTTRLDDRVKAMIDMKTKPLYQLIQQIYPDLYPIHNLESQEVILNAEEEPIPMPPRLQLTARCLENKGAFLMDTGDHMVILVCPNVSQNFLNDALGVSDYNSISDQMYEIPILDNINNQRLHQFVNYLNDEKPYAATLQIIRDNSPNRMVFFERLIEDRVENALSYHEFLQHLKTQIK